MNCISRALVGAAVCLGVILALPSRGQDLDPAIKKAEAERIAVIEKVKPAVVAVFGPGGQGGGSGVLIDEDGYALTNFHVTAGAGNTMKCGLPDGVLYDAVLVGLDKVGDVALIKLYPKKEGQKFPFAPLGDSDKLKAGEWSLAMGNPFLLATDFTPTVTFGLISGVHRYQYPAGVLLEYTDCIQIDTSINPGNSGGPLFNMKGELVGINGRGSFDKRTRINSGVGYAISINQIKNFLGHLRVGLDTDHASLGAIVESEGEDGANPRMIVKALIESADVTRRGVEIGDELRSFAGRPLSSVNQYKNVLGLYPRGWRMPLTYVHTGEKQEKKEVLVRLMGVQRQELADDKNPMPPPPGPGPRPGPVPTKPSPVAKYFEAKPGFANHYFNKVEKERLYKAFQKHGDFSTLKGEWVIKAVGEADNKPTKMDLNIREDGTKTNCRMEILGLEYKLDPLDTKTVKAERDPPKSGGLLMALFLYRQMLAFGEKGFAGGEFTHGGQEPFYPPPPKAGKVDLKASQVMCEVLKTRYAGVSAKWYFSLKDQRLLGFEVEVEHGDDPCEVFLLDYKNLGGRMLPGKMTVRHGDETYAEFTAIEWGLAAK